jgi:hypothetical protein
MPFLWRSEGEVERNGQQQANKPHTFRYIVQIPVRPKYLECSLLELMWLNPNKLAHNINCTIMVHTSLYITFSCSLTYFDYQ